uniref:uncharacterized protein LOC122603803 n=1 Tax=Erigeron canadensis TaxID=72917 RepID=UPI001CB932CA|nr:uncharacterized protein LOC122603803 [Erigeron canadensis]XP_043632563.1 uncharacterized protein LOC122603803 [Erigeron canadensis]
MAAGRIGGEEVMSSSRGQVTITLGRAGGQVVKRSGGGELAEEEDAGLQVAVGSKRRGSVRDRLGADPSSSHLLHNKRLCGDNGSYSLNPTNSIDDLHLSKHDLRYKIIKRTQTNTHHKTVDLRDMLSRRARPSTTKPDTLPTLPDPEHGRHRVPEIIPVIRDDRRRDSDPRDNPRRMPEPRNERHIMPAPRDERQHMPDPLDERRRLSQPMDDRHRVPESRDDRHRVPESRDDRHCVPESRDDTRRVAEYREDRQTMPEPRDGRQSIPELLEVRKRIPNVSDTRQSIPEPSNGSMTRHFTSMRTSEAPSQMDFLTSSYSPWTLDHIRRKSPDRVLHISRGLSPPQRNEEPQRRPIMRAYQDSRPVQYSSRDGSDISRPISTTSFLTKPSLSAGPTKPMGPMVAPPIPPGHNMQRSQYPVEHLTVEGFLRSLGLEKYLISFKVEEVDMAALSQMGDHDLKEIGIPMGPRKKILLALLARTRRHAR